MMLKDGGTDDERLSGAFAGAKLVTGFIVTGMAIFGPDSLVVPPVHPG